MSEAAFRIFYQGISFGAELLYAAGLVFLLQPFTAQQKRQRLPLVFAASLLIRQLCDSAAIPQGAFGLLLILLLAAAEKALGLEKAMALLLGLLYWNTRVSSGLIAESLYFILEQSLPPGSEPPEAVYLRAAVIIALFLLFHAALFAAMLCAIRRRIRAQKLPLCRWQLCCLCLAPATGILFGQIIFRLLSGDQDGALFWMYQKYPAFLATVPLIAVLLYAGAYLTITIHQKMAALQEEQAIYCVERRQVQAIRARIHEAEQCYSHIRGVKHDMRGHLTNIRGLVRSGEYDSLEAYLAQLSECIFDSDEWMPETGNPVTDVIVGDTRQHCLDLGIEFEVDFYYPQQGSYDAFDLGIILQNLLQNAVEACETVEAGQRRIALTGKKTGHFFLLEVKNSFAGEVVFGQDGLPVTAKKEDAFLHGIGLSNVRREAEKYMGQLELKADRQEFSATVLLQERSST